jgi:hypothetical protein
MNKSFEFRLGLAWDLFLVPKYAKGIARNDK